MEGKLIKKDDHYFLEVEPYTLNTLQRNALIANTFDKPKGDILQLSLTNCQAIERGYDLYKLAEEEYLKHENNELLYGDSEDKQLAYKAGIVDGFPKALEILGDKKFSAGQLLNAMDLVWQWMNGEDYGCKTLTEVQDKHIQSLQQTEWDVTFDPDEKDANGRLILKRK